jgi:hypothetical protein
MTTKKPAPVRGKQSRDDGWSNILTGLASRQDPTTRTGYKIDPLLDRETLTGIFMGDGIGRRIVEMPASEMTRQWFTIEGDEGGKVADCLEEMDVQGQTTEALTWARLYGGAVLFHMVDDGQNLDAPVNESNIRRYMGVHSFDRHEVNWTTALLNNDPMSPNFNKPEYYQITPVGGTMITVHYSRISVIDGDVLPSRSRQQNNWWGASVLQGCFSYLTRYGENLGYSANIIRDFIQTVLSVKGLQDMLASGQDDLVKKRVQLLDLSRSVLNMAVLDADGEQYSKVSSSIAGLPDLMDRFSEALSASTNIPMTKLLGRSPAGMNATGEADTRAFYDFLAAEQKRKLKKPMETVVKFVYLSKDGPTNGLQPEAWSIKWSPLWQPTEAEIANTRKVVADTDVAYINAGVLTSDEVAKCRFHNGYSMETSIEIEDEFEDPDDSEIEDDQTPDPDEAIPVSVE